jgi:hypothetical protein
VVAVVAVSEAEDKFNIKKLFFPAKAQQAKASQLFKYHFS